MELADLHSGKNVVELEVKKYPLVPKPRLDKVSVSDAISISPLA